MYIDTVDATGHQYGPSSQAFDAEAVRCLDAIDAAIGLLPSGTLLLLAADHGQVDVDPARTRFVNELWPEIGVHLRRDARGRPLAPAGSARDLFLHTAPGAHRYVVDRLRALLGAHARRSTPPPTSSRRACSPARSGLAWRRGSATSASFPAEGETVWWRERGRFGMRFRGHHGGLTPDEAHTVVASLVVD